MLTNLLNASLFALCWRTGNTFYFPATDIMFSFCDLDIEGI